MTRKYFLRALAQADLEAIWVYTFEQWGQDQADSDLKLLIQRFDWLAENPGLAKPREDIKQGYFCFLEGMHLIFYILKNKQIEIIGLPQQRMDVVEYWALV